MNFPTPSVSFRNSLASCSPPTLLLRSEVLEAREGGLWGLLSGRGMRPLFPFVAEGALLPCRVAEGDRRFCLPTLGEGLFRRGGGFLPWGARWSSRGLDRSFSLLYLLGGAFVASGLCFSRAFASFVGLVASGGWPSRRLRTAYGLSPELLTGGCFRLTADFAEGEFCFPLLVEFEEGERFRRLTIDFAEGEYSEYPP